MDTQIQKRPAIAITPCESSRIHGYGYDAATQTLALQFKSKGGPGSIYHYAGVPAPVFSDLQKAESLGRFFGEVIQSKDEDGNLNYPFTKVEPAPVAEDVQ